MVVQLAYINIYRYSTGRIHAGTGLYSSLEEADRVAKNKDKRIAVISILMLEELAEAEPYNGGYRIK